METANNATNEKAAAAAAASSKAGKGKAKGKGKDSDKDKDIAAKGKGGKGEQWGGGWEASNIDMYFDNCYSSMGGRCCCR